MERTISCVLRLAAVLVTLLHQPQLLMAWSSSLTPGSTLKPRQFLTSPNGVFAFGFCNVDPDQLILAIWFDFGAADCANKMVVWFARDPDTNQVVVAKEQAVLTFTDSNRPLSLNADDSSGSPLWSPILPDLGPQFSSALNLLDSGDLQLLAAGAGGGVAWQSFEHPTHTLLPGQTMTNTTGKYLLSKNTDTDFSPGRFTLIVQDDGNIVLYMRDTDHPDPLNSGPGNAYWAAGTWHAYQGPVLSLDSSGNILCRYDDSTENLTTWRHSKLGREYHHYAALDPDGTVRVYAHRKNSSNGASWDVVALFPDDGCNRRTNEGLQGVCGPNAYCTLSSSQEQRLKCECADHHEFLDRRHEYKGCMPSFITPGCNEEDGSAGEKITMVEMRGIEWSNQSTYKKYQLIDPTTAAECNASCLTDCLCAAVLINGTSCMFVGMLTQGKWAPSTDMKVLMKVGISSPVPAPVIVPAPVPFPARATSRSIWLYITICILATFCIASATYILGQCYISEKKARRRRQPGLRIFTYKELHRATNGFKEVLGKGGFGEVCKGELSSLQPPYIAVKKLITPKGYSEKDFENEVQSIGQIHHKNIVHMIGYCKEGVHRMLVFEYMEGGTLASLIFQPERPCWSYLTEVAVGIAKGLEYLHEGCKSKIIHCDIKPDNILFDDKHTPRITDFGIAKLLGDQKTQYTVTTIAGTKPYVAPEWFDDRNKVDSKVDVYSFGLVLLEMICCRKAAGEWSSDSENPSSSQALRTWVENLIRNGRPDLLVQGEDEALADIESVERFACVAIRCLQKDPSTRPTMHMVVQMLEGTMEVDPLPENPIPNVSAVLPTSSEIHLSGSMVSALQIE